MPASVFRKASGAPPLDSRVVKRRAELMLASLGCEGAELSVLLTNDAGIHALNREHRKKDKPTDVLAFPMDADGAGPSGKVQLLGDVVISLDTAARQAKERSHSLLDEITHLLAHGVLHLVGHDHRNDAEERRMNAAARSLIERANGQESGVREAAAAKTGKRSMGPSRRAKAPPKAAKLRAARGRRAS